MQLLPRLDTRLHSRAAPQAASTGRLASIDQFRGFAILAMVLGNYLIGVTYLPAWLKHSPDIGLTLMDLGAPWFIFAISLTVRLSARRRLAAGGWRHTLSHGFTRSMALVGIGSILGAGQIAFGLNPGGVNWGVLQAIGAANLLTLLVIGLACELRLALGLLLLWGYQFTQDRFWLESVLNSPHGGIQGVLAWAAMMILGTVLADLFHGDGRGRDLYPWAAAVMLAVGIGLAVWVPVSKNRMSASYVLITLGISALLFLAFHLLTPRLNLHVPLLVACGRNPLLLYLIHQVLLGLLVLPALPAWYAQAPPPLMVLQAAALLGAVAWIGRELDRQHIYFTL